jgi:ketoreductase RED2
VARPDLADKVAIVTGSSSGIGEATARRLADDGAALVINSSTSVAAGEKLAGELPNAIYVQADVSDDPACHRLVAETLERFGRLDILVNNAGTTQLIPHSDLDAATDEVWRRIFDVNVLGTWHMTRAAVDALRQSGSGCVINITSLAGLRATGSSIPYAASKAAINHMTVLLANVLGPQVRVNAVAPGLVDTPWTAEWDAIRSHVTRTAPLGRTGLPEDIAEAVLGMVHNRYATGQVLAIDGGLGLR